MKRLQTGERLTREDGIRLLRDYPLGELMYHANRARQQRHPSGQVTFVRDTNPNYTNVCATACRFCAFWRKEGHPEAYTLEADALAQKVARAADAGVTTVLLQGGHHPAVTLETWIAYIRAIQKRVPHIHIHPFSPSEIHDLAGREGITTRAILERLWSEGIRTIPGAGAEILSDRVRQLIAPGKCSAQQWLEVTQEAHEIGFKTTATLMYGHLETQEEIIDHLLALRGLQDQTGGFQSFIPWSFKPGATPLSKRIDQPAPPQQYPRIIAVARLMLDNFEHIQSSWFSEDREAGLLGLLAGANDYGGLLFEENVLDQAGHAPKISEREVRDSIREMGFVPAQRDSFYNLVGEHAEINNSGSLLPQGDDSRDGGGKATQEAKAEGQDEGINKMKAPFFKSPHPNPLPGGEGEECRASVASTPSVARHHQ